MDNLQNEPISKLLKMAHQLEKKPDTYSVAKDSGKHARIAVLGSHSIQHFVRVLRLFLDRAHINGELYEGEYGGISMDALDNNSPLFSFRPEIVVLLLRYTDFPMETRADLEKAKAFLRNIRVHISQIPGVMILCSNIALPLERPYGSLEAAYGDSRLSLFKELNLEMTRNRPSNVRIVDMEYLSSYYGKQNWFDDTAYYLSKQGFSMDYLGPVAHEVTQMIRPLLGTVRKCLVLDLDNTLWGGVVADEGALGIELDPHNPIGEAYRAFQRYVLSLKNRGVILAVNSKNDEEIAKEPFSQNPDMILKLSDIACFVANWSDKASNMAYIAKRLNIGIDSLVFFDDNPVEREIIETFCPQVQVIDVPEEPENYIRALDQASPFEWSEITEEDRSRASSYAENAAREELAVSFADYRDYLKALQMTGKAAPVAEAEIGRFTQLTNKSNQFNVRTMRFTEGEIRNMAADSDFRLIAVSLTDKFTRYGVISCIILKRGDLAGFEKTDCFIENWCMSCRVLKRSVEQFAFREIAGEARDMGCKRLIGEYVRTRKNGMVEGLFAKLGFVPLSGSERVLYEYDLAKVPEEEIFIGEENYYLVNNHGC
ncbi:MAG: HAD-IIIC family phosphatase [Lachnospiraceae bacterium]|nr:HAD-IIIC family phosphatase [Lachnospiraceae bacterium]